MCWRCFDFIMIHLLKKCLNSKPGLAVSLILKTDPACFAIVIVIIIAMIIVIIIVIVITFGC